MATLQKNHPQNVPGPLFTDTTCIDCGTCFHLAPTIFKENTDDKSIVMKQPHGPKEWQLSKMAILSCPTNSIGVHEAPPDFKELPAGLPFLIEDNVYYCGYTARESFGATSYLIQREEGNILVDSPRFHPWLVKEIEKLGGIKYMFLSHQDDVADHVKFHKYFGCERIIHKEEVNGDLKQCEIILRENKDLQFTPDLKILFTPGHTRGHLNLLYKEKFLFTGDHLFVDPEQERPYVSKGVCWFSWSEQVESVRKLSHEKFQWILPGHGGWGYFGVESNKKINELLERLKG